MYMHVKHWCHFNISARTYFWSRDKCLWRRETWSSFSKLSKSTQMPLPSSQTTCSMSFYLPLCRLPQDLSVIWCSCFKLLQFSQTWDNPTALFSLSLSLSHSVSFYFQRVSPELARQIMLHHVWILAGPSLLDEVGTRGCLLRISVLKWNSISTLSCSQTHFKVFLPCWVQIGSLILFIPSSCQLPAVVHQ